jgi:uncharacterized protein (UPF0333 family)
MRKAQGALEYLIIIAAVLAIAAIVVLFLTGAFKGATGGGDIAKCRLAASTCASNIASGVYSGSAGCITSCVSACGDSSGKDLISLVVPVPSVTSATCTRAGGATGCAYCTEGNTSLITK